MATEVSLVPMLMDYPRYFVVQSMRTLNTDAEWHAFVDYPLKKEV